MAVTANQVVKRQERGRRAYPVEENVRIYEGSLVFINAAGYADVDDAAGLNRFAGIAVKECDNTGGADGDKTVEVFTTGGFLLTGSGFAQTSVGLTVCASDNYTIALTNAGLTTPIGRVSKYVSSTSVWVEIDAWAPYDGRLRTPQSVANVHDTAPTIAELTAAFGAPASLGRGFLASVDDNDGDTNHYLVSVSDASFFFIKLTKSA